MSLLKRWNVIHTTRPTITIIGLESDQNYIGPRNVCRNCIVKASPKNIDLTWIESSRAAVEDESWPLEPGETITMPINSTSQINVLFKSAGDRLFVFFDNR